jgi:hypothetical protein
VTAATDRTPPEGSRPPAVWFARIESALPGLYLLFAVPALLFLVFAVPPFQAPDEIAHAFRAYQVSRGGIVGIAMGEAEGGGYVDDALVATASYFQALPFHTERKLAGADLAAAPSIRGIGRAPRAAFTNTAVYGPIFYLPQALAIRLAEAAHLGVIDSLRLARLASGLSACLLAFAALNLCRRGRALMYAVLLLPMALFEFASLAQDGLLIAGAAWMIALASALDVERRPARLGELLFFLLLLAAGAMGRPPWLFFGLLLPLLWCGEGAVLRGGAFAGRLLAVGVTLGVVGLWFALTRAPALSMHLMEGDSFAGQLAYLLAHPLEIARVPARTLIWNAGFCLKTFIGMLGWLDTEMPATYYPMAGLWLFAALLADMGTGRPLSRLARCLGAAAAISNAAAILGLLYLSFTPVAQPVIYGVQGRYFLAVAPLLAWLLPGLGDRDGRALSGAWPVVAYFPLVTLWFLPVTILERYYIL